MITMIAYRSNTSDALTAQPLTLVPLATRRLRLGLDADYGPYRDAFTCGLGHSRSTGIPTLSRFLSPTPLRVRLAITIMHWRFTISL